MFAGVIDELASLGGYRAKHGRRGRRELPGGTIGRRVAAFLRDLLNRQQMNAGDPNLAQTAALVVRGHTERTGEAAMTYLVQDEIANNRAMLNRVAQAAAQEKVSSDPDRWAYENRRTWASAPGWDDSWESAKVTHPEDGVRPRPG